METKQTYLVTGVAGFIGFHVAKKFLERGDTVVGIDNFNDYYDPAIKEARVSLLKKFDRFVLHRGDIADVPFIKSVFAQHSITVVCHLAAQAGVRYSITHPYKYIDANIVGFATVIHEAKEAGIKNFVFASSSSVYGDSKEVSFSETTPTDTPISLYAATKKANEVMAHSYHHLFGMACTGLRFFTAYGPWGRPDMALFSFSKAIFEGGPISVFNKGDMLRDFTYVEDIAEGVVAACDRAYSFEIINLGNSTPIKLSHMIELLEKEIGKSAIKELLPMQPGDVLQTCADITKAKALLGWGPHTNIEKGIKAFVEWYKDYYHLQV